MKNPVSLRAALQEDAEFLFDVKILGMKQVHDALHPDTPLDREAELKKYMEGFEPEKVNIIVYGGKDVGRLRVVRSPISIYIGGLQLLPEFQGKGIGGWILRDLIDESDRTGIPLMTETHHVNKINVRKKMERRGFKEIGRNERQVILRYEPPKR